MAKLTLADVSNLSGAEQAAITTINSNLALIETAMENTLSRDGTSPNTMGANLDMNSNRITNLPAALSSTEPVRKAEFDELVLEGVSDSVLEATYVVLSASDTFDNERTLAVTAPVIKTDNGAGSTVNISVDLASQSEAEAGVASNKLMTPQRTAQAIAALAPGGGGGGAPTGAEYVVLALNAGLSAERVLAATAPVTITDGGAGGNITVAVTIADQSEAEAGSINNELMTPLRTSQAIDAQAESLGVLRGVNTQTDSYTLVLTDAGKVVEINKATAVNLTVPQNSSVAFPTGSRVDIVQYGAGQITLVADTNVTIRSNLGLKIADQYTGCTLYKRGTNEWVAIGNLEA